MNFATKKDGTGGIAIKNIGNITIICWASTIDHIWFRDADSKRLKIKFPIVTPYDAVLAESATPTAASSAPPS
jgi:hypothetical protein